jgi:2,4-dihydroxyhept-2-ene-1,7-dioic acid aldolase
MKTGLKARMAKGERLYGMFVMLPSPAVVEMVGYAGYDYVILDGEHGAAGTETLENQLRAADAAGISALVRICGQTPAEILHALDAGACGIVVPHVLDAAQARDLVAAAHYPPRGRRGMATTARAGRHGMVSLAEHLETAAREIIVVAQIEDAEALPHAREIAAVDGLDAVFVGPADLSMSMGHPGQPGHPEVAAAIDEVARQTRAAGKVAATFARTAQDATALAQRGFQAICLSTTAVFSQCLVALAKELPK